MGSKTRYDLVVIGSGPAGESGAVAAAAFGKRVAVVERAPYLGGASANTGTLPSKTLRETALAISGLRTRDLYGVDLSLRREATIADLMHHEHRVKTNTRERIRRNIAQDQIDLIRGTARFVDPHTLAVTPPEDARTSSDGHGGERLVEAEVILIATGSSPVHPPLFPFEDDRVHDSDEILTLERLPQTLAVVGAGVIGTEYACTFAALGVKTYVLDGRSELLPFLDSEVSAALEESMKSHLGVTFLWNERVTACEVPAARDEPVTLVTSTGRRLTVDGVLVAAGRQSNTAALNLAAAGITPGEKGLINVNARFQTSVPHIYAAGDVVGFPALAATSMEQGRIAICSAFEVAGKCELSPLLPTGIYAIPEVSQLGASEEELKQKGIDYVVGRAPYSGNARGEIIGERYGFLKLLFRRDDMALLGVHVIGEQATELVHIGLMAMLSGGGADLFDRACFNYPTLGDLYKDATYDALLRRRQIDLATRA